MQPAHNQATISLKSHITFMVSAFFVYLLLFALLRGLLLLYNADLIADTQPSVFLESFLNGLRFDGKISIFFIIPLLLAISSVKFIQYRRFFVVWLTVLASISLLLGMIELNFYREFHQRLNSIFFQYLSEDPQTVISMLWYGFPVVRLLLAWLLLSLGVGFIFAWLERRTRSYDIASPSFMLHLAKHSTVFLVCVIIAVVVARSTLRQGAPLRWGDAFTTHSLFANHLGLNGVLSLADSARNNFSSHRNNIWQATLDKTEAHQAVRQLLLTPNDQLIDAEQAVIRRISHNDSPLKIRNVVIILMESFAGRYVGALGGSNDITPYFDALTEQGVLFTQFFANGTHTHQGMFASMACFPNLPAFEYLMQTPEGGHLFSGLPQLLSRKDYQNLYVYNGDFAWDNQQGFFSNQGMTRFIGRGDYIDPVFSDPTWGVSDEDMFNRAFLELDRMDKAKPFYALLQTLSNHTPYPLPSPLPVAAVEGFGSRNEHLTAMRYSDWALGQFFAKAKMQDWYDETLFVILGDHGFGAAEQLTEMDLYRFYVPMLMIAPGIQAHYGKQRNTVASQVDMVPTIMGLLGGQSTQQCWGRDILHLPKDDSGFAIIKPSGDDQTVAMVLDSKVLIKPKNLPPRAWSFQLGQQRSSQPIDDLSAADERLFHSMYSYIQSATESLLNNTTGAKAVAISHPSDSATSSAAR